MAFNETMLAELKKSLELADRTKRKRDQLRDGIEAAKAAHSLHFVFGEPFRIFVERTREGPREQVCWADDILGDLQEAIRVAFIEVAEQRLAELEAEFQATDVQIANAIGMTVELTCKVPESPPESSAVA